MVIQAADRMPAASAMSRTVVDRSPFSANSRPAVDREFVAAGRAVEFALPWVYLASAWSGCGGSVGA